MNAALPVLWADWPAPATVRACTTLRYGAGVSAAPFDTFNLGRRNGDAPLAVAHNRAQLRDGLCLPGEPRWLRQVHGIDVLRADAAADARQDDEPQADAAITSTPRTVLAVLTADCLPVVFAAVRGDEIAVAHAGWRGLAAGILEATLHALRTPPQHLLAWLGPAAGPDAYEVGDEVCDAFVTIRPQAADAFVATRPGHWRMDLYALARQRLVAAGMRGDAIHGGGQCTISEPQRFFSHRRDGASGRIATLAWLETRD